MLTLEPPMRTGRSGRDEALLPFDEYLERVQRVRRAMVEEGFDALVLCGNSGQGGGLSYLAGMVPWYAWAMLVLRAEGDPSLICLCPARERPVVEDMTWIRNIHTPGGNPRAAAKLVREELDPPPRSLGLVGADHAIEESARVLLDAALEGIPSRSADDILGKLMRAKRPRERVALRDAAAMARTAADIAARLHAEGKSNGEAALAADRTARQAGAHDVRILANLEGGWISPLESVTASRQSYLTLYCAVENDGYWGHAAVASPGLAPSAGRALAAMAELAKPGIAAADLARAALESLSPEQAREALSFGLGGGTGLFLDEAPMIAPESRDILAPGDVLSLRVWCGEGGRLAVAQRMVIL